jgi:hypothetical protein
MVAATEKWRNRGAASPKNFAAISGGIRRQRQQQRGGIGAGDRRNIC